MRFGFIGSCPLHLVSLSSLPLHILLFPLFFHVLLSSCLVISSFSSFACTLVPALVCTCTLHTFKHRLQVAQVFTMRWASSGVPVHLVPLSFQPHAPLSRLVLLSCLHSFVLCAHTCTLALTLDFRLPSGRRVCVCVTLGIIGILSDCFRFGFCLFILQQGAHGHLDDVAANEDPSKLS